MKTLPRITVIRETAGRWNSPPWGSFAGAGIEGSTFWNKIPLPLREGPDIFLFPEIIKHEGKHSRFMIPVVAHELCHWIQWLKAGKPLIVPFQDMYQPLQQIEKVPARVTILLCYLLFLTPLPHWYDHAGWRQRPAVLRISINNNKKEGRCPRNRRSSGGP